MPSRNWFAGIAVLAGLGCAAGCSQSAPSDEPVDALDSALSAEDFDATVRQLTALPYLPWGYTPDGCYARALYYSMLLATKGVPTNHLYVVARPGTKLGGQWSWHVAPLVTKDGDPNHLFVLDPVYDQTRALTNVEWVAKQDYPNPTASQYPTLHVNPGTSYLAQYESQRPLASPAEPSASTYKEPVFSEMPSFKMADVSAACDVMHRYIDREPNSSASQRDQKHRSLGRETQKIVQGLVGKAKLTGNPTLGSSCTRNQSIDGGAEPVIEADDAFIEPTRATL